VHYPTEHNCSSSKSHGIPMRLDGTRRYAHTCTCTIGNLRTTEICPLLYKENHVNQPHLKTTDYSSITWRWQRKYPTHSNWHERQTVKKLPKSVIILLTQNSTAALSWSDSADLSVTERTSVIRVVNSWTLQWAVHMVKIKEMPNIYRIFVRKPLANQTLERPRSWWEKIRSLQIGYMDWQDCWSAI